MSFTTNSLPNPKAPANPVEQIDPQAQKKKIDQLKKDNKTIQDLKNKMDQSISEVDKNLSNTFGKSAKNICLLRLDMISDKLDHLGSSRLASKIDDFANKIELEDWF